MSNKPFQEASGYTSEASEDQIETYLKMNPEELRKKMSKVFMDPNTFAPFVVIDSIRFNIEALQDTKTQNSLKEKENEKL